MLAALPHAEDLGREAKPSLYLSDLALVFGLESLQIAYTMLKQRQAIQLVEGIVSRIVLDIVSELSETTSSKKSVRVSCVSD
jgi:hypothetical protein